MISLSLLMGLKGLIRALAGFLFLAAGLWAQCSFNFSPSLLSFGDVPVGSQKTLQLTLTLVSGTFSVTSSDPTVFSPLVLPPSSSSQMVNVTFRPNSIGSFNAKIHVHSSCMYDQSDVDVPATGTGVASFSVSPDPLDFGAVLLGCPSTMGLTVSGSSSLNFTVSTSPSEFRVSPSSFIGSRIVGVTFTPDTLGFMQGSATVMATSAGEPVGNRSTSLVGFGLDLVIAPARLDFGSVPVGTSSAAQSFQIKTNPATSASFEGIPVDSSDPAFSSTPLSASGVGQVRFTPPAPGPFAAIVSVTLAGDSSPNCFLTRRVAVTGVGVVPGSITAAPAALDFAAKAGAPLQERRLVAITSPELANLQWGAAVTGGTPRWLRLNPAAGGGVPGYLLVAVDTTGLGAGTQQAEIVITGRPGTSAAAVLPDTGDVSQSLPTARLIARLTVADAPPALSVGPPVVSLVGFEGANSVLRQSLSINNTGGGSLPWTARVQTTGAPFPISVSLASGTAPSSLVVTADTSGLAVRVYQAVIQVFAGQQEVDVPVTLLVSRAGPFLTLGRTGLVFETLQGTGVLSPQGIRVLNTGLGSVNWTTNIFAISGPKNWLSFSPASGTSDAAKLAASPQIAVTSNASGLPAGLYSALLRTQSPQALNGAQFATVILNVLAPGSAAPLSLNPGGLVFSAVAGGPQPAPQTLEVRIASPQLVNFAASATAFSGGNWPSVAAAPRSASAAQPAQVQVRANTTGLAPGAYQGQAGISLADGTSRLANLLLIVTPPATGPAAKDRGVEAGLPVAADCSPSKLVVNQTVLASNFTVRASWPIPIEAQVNNDCGAPVETAHVITAFSNGVLLTMHPEGAGRYSATWSSPAADSQVNVTTYADAEAGRLNGNTAVVGNVDTNPSAFPTVNGVVHSATSKAGALAPGVTFSAYGQNFATTASPASSLPLPTNLSGASVVVAGREAPLYYASGGQINAQLPYEIQPVSHARMVVRAGSFYSVVDPPLTIDSAQPGIFLVDGRAAAQNLEDYRLNATENPVARGGYVIIYFAGLGAVDPPVATGAAAPAEPLAKPVLIPEASIGGRPAPIAFIGLTPGLAGLAQAVLQVPIDIPAGNAEVVLTIGGQRSNSAPIAVK